MIITKIGPKVAQLFPDQASSAGLPGIDWSIVPTGGTNGEAATNDFPDLGFATFLRRTGNTGANTTYGNNLKILPTPLKIVRDGWKLYFTSRTTWFGTNAGMNIHLRSDALPIITRSIVCATDTTVPSPDFRCLADGTPSLFVMQLSAAEAANLDYAQQPWHVSLDFGGIDQIATWDFSSFKLEVPK
jgi:hypothetical protein